MSDWSNCQYVCYPQPPLHHPTSTPQCKETFPFSVLCLGPPTWAFASLPIPKYLWASVGISHIRSLKSVGFFSSWILTFSGCCSLTPAVEPLALMGSTAGVQEQQPLMGPHLLLFSPNCSEPNRRLSPVPWAPCWAVATLYQLLLLPFVTPGCCHCLQLCTGTTTGINKSFSFFLLLSFYSIISILFS